jgi:excisionase family DNA binding protein
LAPVIYTAAEAREILKVSRSLMSKLLVNGDIRSFKVGRDRRITEEALKAYIAEQLAAAA